MKKVIERYQSVILSFEILLWENEPTSYRFKSRFRFIDDSELIVRDYLFQTRRKYSYHWQSKDGQLLVRWDNAEHWKQLHTFPHHKHIKEELLPSKETTIEDVLDHIYKRLA
jgi:hypothetical protein